MKLMNSLYKIIKDPKLILSYIISTKYFNRVPDKAYLEMKYRIKMNKKLDFEKVKSFNDKLQWLKLYDRKDDYPYLVDKYHVRKFVKEKIGEEYLIPLVGVYDGLSELDFSKLPNQFVLKATHDSGSVIVCKDKSKLNIKEVQKKLNKSLKTNFYYRHREWTYKNLKPRIICEKYMEDRSDRDLKDYKVFCFNGEPQIIQVDFDRFTSHKRNLYDLNWNYLSVEYKCSTDENVKIQKPKKLEEMLDLSRTLAEKLTFIRIDFYSINNKLYFGEMTFYPEAGFGKFKPEYYDLILGEKLILPNKTS